MGQIYHSERKSTIRYQRKIRRGFINSASFLLATLCVREEAGQETHSLQTMIIAGDRLVRSSCQKQKNDRMYRAVRRRKTTKSHAQVVLLRRQEKVLHSDHPTCNLLAFSCSRVTDMQSLKQICRYVQQREELLLDTFVDVHRAGQPDRKSVSGGAMFLDGCCSMTWSRTQKTLVTFLAESELFGLGSCACEALGVRELLLMPSRRTLWQLSSTGNHASSWTPTHETH